MTESIRKQNTKKTGGIYTYPLQVRKKKLVEFTLYLLLHFYLNRYSGGVYNRSISWTF
jgi:hypothetical protein